MSDFGHLSAEIDSTTPSNPKPYTRAVSRSLGSDSTLTRQIVFFFQKINPFFLN
jgi:hypothetical protein